jgi:hypothetical protein
MNKKLSLALCGICLFTIVGCGTTAKFVYPADGRTVKQVSKTPLHPTRVAVVPFEDMRGDKNQSGTYFLYMIPLMPCGWGEYERPDAARMFNTVAEFQFDAGEDLAKAAAYSLSKSGLFQDAFFTYGGDKDRADYLLKGEMLSTTYKGTLWTYGLSVYGPMLWFFGLPAGTSYNEIILSMSLTDLSTGQSVWAKKYNVNDKIVQGLYYKMGHDVKGYSKLMQDIMNDAVTDISSRQCLKSISSSSAVADKPVVGKSMIPVQATSPVKSATVAPKAVDTTDQLKKLKELKDAGLLTDEEYETKRKELVGQL